MCIHKRLCFGCNHTASTSEKVSICQTEQDFQAGHKGVAACAIVYTHPLKTIKVAELCRACRECQVLNARQGFNDRQDVNNRQDVNDRQDFHDRQDLNQRRLSQAKELLRQARKTLVEKNARAVKDTGRGAGGGRRGVVAGDGGGENGGVQNRR